MRQIFIGLSAIALAGCAREAPRVGMNRVALVPAPGAYGYDVYKDGRLAFSKYVRGVAAIYVAARDGTNPKRVSFGVWDIGPLWSPDGKWLAFARDNGNNDVVIVPADSGPERIVAATAAEETPNAWLPDGTGLLFSRGTERGKEVWVYHMADGTSAKLFDVAGSVDAYPSPDGKWIAYTLTKGGLSTVWLWDREKKTHRQLTTEGFEVVERKCFSPDGKTIAYVSSRTGTRDVWSVDIASGERHQLTQDIAGDFHPRWSPDGTRIAFVSQRGGQQNVWVMSGSKGETEIQRITDDALPETDVNWMPDGKSVVMQTAIGHRHVYALPLDGGAAVPLTSGEWDVTDADVSPDGSTVVYTGSKNGDLDVWSVPAAGGASHLVNSSPAIDDEGKMAPDNKHVAFVSTRSGNSDIWVAPADSGPALQLTKWPSSEVVPRWSPDGKWIAFESNHDASGYDLWVAPATGGEAKRITTLGTVDPNYRWSPDGKTIAFSAQPGKGSGRAVFTVPVAGGVPKQIGPVTSGSPEWSPDGHELMMILYTKGYSKVAIFDANGKELRTLTPRDSVYEYGAAWTRTGAQAIVGAQDLATDGHWVVDVRSAAGGSSKPLDDPPGYSMFPLIGISAADKAAIVLGGPMGTALQEVPVPEPPKP